MNNTLKQLTYDFIQEQLAYDDYIGVSADELASRLTETHNANGSWYCSAFEAREELLQIMQEDSTLLDEVIEQAKDCGQDISLKIDMSNAEVLHCLVRISAVDIVVHSMLSDNEIDYNVEEEDLVVLQKAIEEKIAKLV